MSKKNKKKRLSERQLAANRENAQKSTGPKDTSQTSQNATTHTLCGSLSSMIKGREEEFAAWREPMARSFQAVGPYETELVSEVIRNMWGVKLSTTHLDWVMNNVGDPMDCEVDVLKRVGLVQRYKTGYERSVVRLRRELTRVQQLRLKANGSRLPIDYSGENPMIPQDPETFCEGSSGLGDTSAQLQRALSFPLGPPPVDLPMPPLEVAVETSPVPPKQESEIPNPLPPHIESMTTDTIVYIDRKAKEYGPTTLERAQLTQEQWEAAIKGTLRVVGFGPGVKEWPADWVALDERMRPAPRIKGTPLPANPTGGLSTLRRTMPNYTGNPILPGNSY